MISREAASFWGALPLPKQLLWREGGPAPLDLPLGACGHWGVRHVASSVWPAPERKGPWWEEAGIR